jgi:hypothetical protein
LNNAHFCRVVESSARVFAKLLRIGVKWLLVLHVKIPIKGLTEGGVVVVVVAVVVELEIDVVVWVTTGSPGDDAERLAAFESFRVVTVASINARGDFLVDENWDDVFSMLVPDLGYY